MTATVAFGDVEVDLDAHEIRRGGTPVPVEPQVFEVLAHLIRHRERLVPKTELLDEVWGDRFVSESALTSRIKAARRAVGDNGRDQRVIRTVHGRGYRFVAEVAASQDGGAPSSDRGALAALAGGGGAAVAVAGPPGRDRRAALDEVYEEAAASGRLAVRGRVIRLAPFAGVLDAVDELVARRPETLAEVPGSCRTELEAVLAGKEPSSVGRFQLAVRELVVAASADGLVLVLHDLELADAASLALVDQLARLTRRHPIVLAVGHERPDRVSDALTPVPLEPGGGPELGEEVTRALARVALLGPTFEVATFRAVTGLDGEVADRVLDVALAAGVLEPAEAGFCFTSPAAAQRLVEDLGPHQRVDAHRQAGEALAGRGAEPGLVAAQFLAAGEPARSAPYALEAARRAAAAHAHAEVRHWTDAAVDHLAGDERAELLALQAASMVATGDPAAPRAYRQALVSAGPDWVPLLRLGLAQACILGGDIDGAAEVLQPMEADGGPWDGPLLLLSGMVAYFRGDLDAAEQAADASRDLALAPGAPALLLDVIALQGMIAHNRGEWFDRMRRELQATSSDPQVATKVFDGQLCVAEYLLYGPLPYEEVVDLARGLQATAVDVGARRAEAFALCLAGEALLLAGRLEEAEADLARSIDLHRELQADAGTAHSLQRLAEVRLAGGDRAEAERLARQSLALARWSPLARHLIQRTYGTLITAAPDPLAAAAVVAEATAAADDNSRCEICDVMLCVPAVGALAAAGDLDGARGQLDRARRSALQWQGTTWEAAVQEAEAALARAEGRDADADALLDRAAAAFERAGQVLDAARCREALMG